MIIYIDMDGVICKLTNKDLRMLIKQGHKHFPPDFFLSLEPMPGAIEAVNRLRSMADVYILTAPSVRNPLCYTEKRLWIEKQFDLELCHRLIISPNKALLKGDILIDDNIRGKGQDGFEGKLIHFGSEDCPDWDAVDNNIGRVLVEMDFDKAMARIEAKIEERRNEW
ncbi:MAG: hypothetical protein HUN04_06025 [Desulfobacter sp.]|nr:MAG: hypothetical protein HUN04_06025 [Desulfobacter sp.]